MKLNFDEIIKNKNVFSIEYIKVDSHDDFLVLISLYGDRNVKIRVEPNLHDEDLTYKIFVSDIAITKRKKINSSIEFIINSVARLISKNDMTDIIYYSGDNS